MCCTQLINVMSDKVIFGKNSVDSVANITAVRNFDLQLQKTSNSDRKL